MLTHLLCTRRGRLRRRNEPSGTASPAATGGGGGGGGGSFRTSENRQDRGVEGAIEDRAVPGRGIGEQVRHELL